MAASVGTNASYVRKVLTLLKRAEIVDSHRGVPGFSLRIPPERLTLLRVYRAVTQERHLLDIHQNASDRCAVGRHIQPVLTGMFDRAESAFARALSEQTLAQCIAGIRGRL